MTGQGNPRLLGYNNTKRQLMINCIVEFKRPKSAMTLKEKRLSVMKTYLLKYWFASAVVPKYAVLPSARSSILQINRILQL